MPGPFLCAEFGLENVREKYFFEKLFDAPFLNVAGETFPGDQNGSVFDGRLIA